MTGDGPHVPMPGRQGTATRGFLFADLRGYTAFVERHGARRAATMLDRYRTLVRAAVAEHDGAEIRTEGDSFYVVFNSASTAIECGLAIVAAAQATDEEPEQAFHVGVGIHAGETIETAEGYVGSAVNIAARICAQAGPNQVLVSGTVRALTSGVVAAAFIPVGRRRLKGLSDPIDLFHAVAEGTTTAPRHRRSVRGGWIAAAAAGLGVLVIAVAILFVRSDAGSSERPSASGPADSGLAAAQPSAATGSSTSEPSATGVTRFGPVGEFPNPQEDALLLLVDERYRADCERGLARDAPGIWFRDSIGGAEGPWVNETVPHQANVTCAIGQSVGPDIVWYWHVEPATQRGITVVPIELVRNHAGRFRAFPGGDGCEATGHAVEDWSFGETTGLLLCYTPSDGDAIIEWGYEDTPVMARAVRGDGDMPALLAWWMETARFGP